MKLYSPLILVKVFISDPPPREGNEYFVLRAREAGEFLHSWLQPTIVLISQFSNLLLFPNASNQEQELRLSYRMPCAILLPHNAESDPFLYSGHELDLSKITCASWNFSSISFLMKQHFFFFFIKLRAGLAWGK